ncbi:MAG: stage II sporulation protein E [Bacillota bacterium]
MDQPQIYTFQRSPRGASISPGKPYRLGAKREKLRTDTQLLQALKYFFSGQTLMLQVMAFLLARAVIWGDLMPLGTAFFAAMATVWRGNIWIMVLPLAIGLWTVVHGSQWWSAMGIIILLATVFRLYSVNQRHRLLVAPLVVMVAVAVVKGGLLAFSAPTLSQMMNVFFESLLSAGLTAVLIIALAAFQVRRLGLGMTGEEVIAVAVLVGGAIAGLVDWNIAGISLGSIASRFVIMAAAMGGGSGGGAAIGAMVGFMPSVISVVAPTMVAGYALSGLVSGLFRNLGRLGIIGGFLLGNLLFSFYMIKSADAWGIIIETGIAGLALLVLPRSFLKEINLLVETGLTSRQTRPLGEQRLRQAAAYRLKELAQVFAELSKTFHEVTGTVEREENNVGSLFDTMATRVCNGCSVFKVCWEKDLYRTYKGILDLFSMAETKGEVQAEDMGPELRMRCNRGQEMAIAVNCMLETYLLDEYWRKKVTESRELVSAQVEGVAGIMNQLAGEILIEAAIEEELEATLTEELARLGHKPERITAIKYTSGPMHGSHELTIQQKACTGGTDCIRVVAPVLATILNQALSVDRQCCGVEDGGSRCQFRLTPTYKLSIISGFAQKPPEGVAVCGDSYSTVALKNGKIALIISDGMGTGIKAAQESRATVSLLERLLRTGFDKELAVQTVNSILLLRSREESFATVDLLMVDLFTGQAEFVKIGAAPSFLKRGSNVTAIRASSVPIGILRTIEVEVSSHQLQEGDLLVIVTDGVLETQQQSQEKEQWLIDLLRVMPAEDPQPVAELLLEQSLAYGGGNNRDDMSILVARIGPP